MTTSSGDAPTTPERILHAAIGRIADAGPRHATIRGIAEAAGVSPGLVIHHFGSKAKLRAACDRAVAAAIRERKLAAVAGSGFDPIAALRGDPADLPLLAYLARAVAEPSPALDVLVDELVDDAVTVLTAGTASGLLQPLDDVAAVARILVLWSLGALALHGQVARLLGVDLTDPAADLAAYVSPASRLLTSGLLTEQGATQLTDLTSTSEEP